MPVTAFPAGIRTCPVSYNVMSPPNRSARKSQVLRGNLGFVAVKRAGRHRRAPQQALPPEGRMSL